MSGWIAKFSNGMTARLGRSRRTFTHAWCATGKRQKDYDHADWSRQGFSSSSAGAARNMESELAPLVADECTVNFREVIPCKVWDIPEDEARKLSMRQLAKTTRSAGTWPPDSMLDTDAYHWLHSEQAGAASIAQWTDNAWHCIGEARPISPQEMARRGWEYLGPCARPTSPYLDN